MRPDPDVIAALTRWLADAKDGDLQDVFIVGRFASGEYGDEMIVADLPDMLCQVRGVVIRLQSLKSRLPQ